MRKLFFMLLVLLLGVTLSHTAQAADYLVSGAGEAAANGTYVESGSFGGRPVYVNGTYRLFFRTCFNRWIIINGSNLSDSDCPRYRNDSTGSLPPETGWTTHNGPAPAPTVCLAQPTVTYSRDLFTELSADDGSIDNTTPLIITHNNYDGDAFDGSVGEDFVDTGKLVVTNLPAGLTVVAGYVDNLTLSVTITGNATAHTIGDDTSDLTFSFQDSAFTLSAASEVSRSYKDDLRIYFYREYMALYAGTEAANGIYGLDGFHNGKMKFTKPGYVMCWYDSNGGSYPRWFIGPDTTYSSRYYEHNTYTSTDLPPAPGSGWRRYGSGTALSPGPDVRIASPAVIYSKTTFWEAPENDGSIDNEEPLIITHNNYGGDEFTGTNGDDFVAEGKIVVTNLPTGLTVVATRTSATELSVTIEGNAASHADANDVNNLTFTFQNTAFFGNDASVVYGSTRNNLRVNFDTVTYVVSGGSAAVNGLYKDDGTYASRPKYVKGSYTMGFRTCNNRWIIIQGVNLQDSDCPIYSNPSTGSLPPETNWSLPSLLVQKAEPILSYSNNIFAESSADDGSINNTSPLIVTHNNSAGDAFDGSVGEDFVATGKLVVTNLPAGLTVVATYVNNLTLSVTITGNATAHTIGDDISDLTFAFQDSAFTLSAAIQVFRSYKDDLRINFYREYMVIDAGTTGANGIYGLDGGFNGKMKFTKAGGVLYWGTSGATSRWQIGPDTTYNNAYYFHNTSTADTPPQTNWRNYYNGLKPAPTVLPAQPALHYSKTFFAESSADDGTIDNTTPLIITHNNCDGDDFTGSNGDDFVGDGKLVVTNRPAGLTVVASRNSNTEISVTLTGAAGSHANADDVNNLTFSFQNSAFSGNDASQVYRSTRNDLEVNFDLERYMVSGSGYASVDGIYAEYGGSFNGKPKYVKDTYRLGYRGCSGDKDAYWVIVNNGDSDLYTGECPEHYNSTNISLPPETGWSIGTPPTVTLVTTPTVSFTAASQTGAENVGTMTITAELSYVSTDDVTVPFTLSGTASEGGTADYTITASPITIPNGSLTQTITITVTEDALDENDETVIVTMGTPTNATQGTTTVHTATITDNDDSPAVSSIVRADANPTNAASVDFTVTFSKSVIGVDTDDFSLTTSGSASGTISNVAGSGTTRTVSVNSITGDGTLRLDVTDNDTITDGVNPLGPGDGSFNTGESYAIDNDTPEISSFERLNPATIPTNADTLVFRATFDEDVQNVDAADFNVNSTSTASVTNVNQVSASTYDVTVSGGDLASFDGTVGLDLAGGQSIADLVGNLLPAGEPGTDETYTVENDPPGLTSFTRQTPATSPTNADTLVFQATFDEDVQNVDAGDFVVNGTTTATVTNVNPVDASTYDVTVSGGDLAGFDGDVGLDLAVGQDITDLAGNALPAGEPATDQTYTVDNDAPGVTSFVYQTPATSPTNADTLVFRATFDDDVQNVDPTDFAVTGTTATVTGVVVVTANRVYDVTVSGGDLAGLNGTIGLDLDGGQNITDLVGNALPAGEPGIDETFTLDNAAPTVTINHGGDDPTDTSPVEFTAVFNEPINATTFTDADVTMGGTATTGTVTVAEEAPPNDGTTFSVSVEVTTNGTVTASIPAGVVEDLAGNTNEASASTDNSVTYEGLPEVTTDSVTGETSHSATVNGTITDLGVSNPTAHGVVWNLVAEGSDPTQADNKTNEGPVGAVTLPYAFTTTMTGLDPNTDYAVRAYATNTAGTAYGNVLTFTTLPSGMPPVYYLLDEPEPTRRR